MSTAEETPQEMPQSIPNVDLTVPPEPKQPEANKPAAFEKKPRLTRACDTCRQKKLRCGHRRIIVDDEDVGAAPAPAAKRNPRTPAPSQTPDQAGSSAINAINLTVAGPSGGGQIQTSQAAAERPRRQGAGKRKLPEAFAENAPPQRPKKAATTAVREGPGNTQQQQRRKVVPRERKQSNAALAEVLDTPPLSDEPSSSQQRQPVPPNTNSVNTSISMAWHQYMSRALEDKIEDTRRKWERTLATVETAQEQWREVVASMKATRQFMQEWTKRFANGQ